MTNINKVSQSINTQVPDFIESDYPLFNKFIEYYYRSQEKTGLGQNIINNFLQYLNIDKLDIGILDGTTKIVETVNKVRGDGNIEYKDGKYVLTSKGQKRFRLVRIMYKRHVKGSSVVSQNISARTALKPTLLSQYGVFEEGVKAFETQMNNYIDSKFSRKTTTQVINEMSVKINATFQNIAFAGWWSVLAKRKDGKYNKANEVARKMLYFGLSKAEFSSTHLKIGG